MQAATQCAEDTNFRTSRAISLCEYLFILVGGIWAFGYRFPDPDQWVEATQVLARLQPAVYSHDLYVQQMLSMTPRYYIDEFVYLLAAAVHSMVMAYWLLYIATFGSTVIGLIAIGRLFRFSRLANAVFVFLCLTAANGTMGSTALFPPNPKQATFAVGVVIWGLYFCFKHDYVKGYLFFGLATIIQFLVGFLPGVLFVLPLVRSAVARRRFWIHLALPLGLLGVGAGLVYVPMVLSGTTSSAVWNNADFVHLYGFVRHPHHIVSSTWGVRNWINFAAFVAAGCILIASVPRLESRRFDLLAVICTSMAALLAGWLFVEVVPLSVIAKLQLARTTPFLQLAVFIAVAGAIADWRETSRIPFIALLTLAPLLHYGGIILLIVVGGLWSVRIYASEHQRLFQFAEWLLLAACVTFLFRYPPVEGTIKADALLLSVLMVPMIIERTSRASMQVRFGLSAATASMVVAFVAVGSAGALPRTAQSAFDSDIILNSVPATDAVHLAVDFRRATTPDSLILVPPSEDSFRFYSERSVVVDWKGFPYTDTGALLWQKRMRDVLGVPLDHRITDEKYTDSLFRLRTPQDLVTLAHRYGADYLMTRLDWPHDPSWHVLCREGSWAVFIIPHSPPQ